ncbi:DUF421 domain-containing protein [Paracoccus sp. CPCC 101403]|uniref:DUF421 domain-containing protein n=2 Tax=Paracoccus broussonetiae TaxID=3075834 RepID=A0ABU3EI90_9RHOB|nr:YetF domain-containing protein [Paracoccus sp. CPCC 101403]MDT1063964.1 DUF421 domain-containing protein [Paracoccus sp. CPCC 101403]
MSQELQRIFMGEQDPLFLAEILFRTCIIYFYTLALMRWIGGRSIAQLSIVEFLLVIAIGSAVGDSLFYPDVPLIPAMLAILLVVLANKLVDLAIMQSSRLTRFFEGSPQVVVIEGRVDRHKIRSRGIGEHELYMKLRDKGVDDLSQVLLAVLETNGTVSVLVRSRSEVPATGLYQPPALPEAELAGAAGITGSASR